MQAHTSLKKTFQAKKSTISSYTSRDTTSLKKSFFSLSHVNNNNVPLKKVKIFLHCVILETGIAGKGKVIGAKIGGYNRADKSWFCLSFFGDHINCL